MLGNNIKYKCRKQEKSKIFHPPDVLGFFNEYNKAYVLICFDIHNFF